MKTKSKILFSSFVAIIFCLSMMVGATFALFTSESKVNVAVSSGNVEVVATTSNLALFSKGVAQSDNTFEVGGTAKMEGNEITINRMVPMDEVKFDITINNYSNVNVLYRVIVTQVEDKGLFDALTVTFTENGTSQVFAGGYSYSDWATLVPTDADAETADEIKTINVSIAFPDGENQNKYQNTACKLTVTVEAVQGNAKVVNPVTKLGDREYEVNSEEGMMLMNGIINSTSHGEGRSLKFYLTDDMDMTGYTWTPISLWWVDVDGQGHTVSNLNCVGDDWGRSGFAGFTGGGSVSNITFENVTSRGTQVGIVSGSCEGFALTNVTIAGTNQVTYDYSINPKETWGGVGAIIGVASYVNAASTITIADGAKVTVDYNGLLTEAPIQNEYALISDISGVVTKNGTVATIGEPYTYVAEGFGLNKNGEYVVLNKAGLESLAASVNEGTTYQKKTVLLMNDIDLNNEDWTPIGYTSKAGSRPFSGTFDGQNHTISNLSINRPTKNDIGLFGYTTNGLVKNLNVKNADIEGYLNVGVVAGTPYTSKYENITVTGDVQVKGMSYVGGVFGKNVYANLTNIKLEANAGSQVFVNSVEEGKAYRTYAGGIAGFVAEGNHVLTNISSNIDVYGTTCDVGGLTGIAHEGTSYVNCTITGNVYITHGTELADAEEIGGLAGVWMQNGRDVTFTNCTFTGKLSAKYFVDGVEYELKTFHNGGLVGKTYGKSGNGTLHLNGKAITLGASSVLDAIENGANPEELTLVSTNVTDIQKVLAKGANVTLAGDVSSVAETVAPYGNKVGYIHKGGTFDGNGNKLTIDCYGDDYGIMTYGGTIKNVVIDGVARAIVLYSPVEDVILDNVYASGEILYPLNTAEHATVPGIDLIVTNSSFGGWASFAGVESASFTDCHFISGKYGYGWPYDCLVKPYINTTFKNCTFEVHSSGNGYYLDLSSLGADCKVVLDQCTVNGVVITAANCSTLFGEVELPSGRTLADCVIFN